MAIHIVPPAKDGLYFSMSEVRFLKMAGFIGLRCDEFDDESVSGRISVAELRARIRAGQAQLAALEEVLTGANDEAVITYG